MKKIMIVEDDKVICQELEEMLNHAGYETVVLQDFSKATEEILASSVDLVLLDINIPVINGEVLLKSIREKSEVPIIMVTSRNNETDEVLSMSFGADDYITKPYNPTLLLLKLEAVFRRIQPETPQEEVIWAGITLNLLRSTMTYEGEERVLSKNEFSIFYYLVKNQGRIVSRDELMDHLWDCNDFVDDNTLTVNINRLRKKLEEAGIRNAIETRRGQGYILL